MTEQAQTGTAEQQPVEKKARKQRSDKGQPRGPRKPKVATTGG